MKHSTHQLISNLRYTMVTVCDTTMSCTCWTG
ncbi:Uncharacterised protein [Mycobacteroides abscessus subsp. abscessus]|nr:Uncharacterised protein [Mycobacteroides abscessus subsp. abscessus]